MAREFDDWGDLVIFLAVAGIVTVLAAIPATIGAHFEAKAFNRCTGGDASTWDALFTELRVERCEH